jgi:tetratricopeptide (TPR) repeat protein
LAHLFEIKDRHVIPNWRTFQNTSRLGELNGSKGLNAENLFKPDISDLLEDWEESKNIGVAADLIGVATICNQEANPTIIKIAEFIIQHKNEAPKALFEAAEGILLPAREEHGVILDISTTESFHNKTHLILIHQRISWYKRRLRLNPSNPVYWIELGRLYTVIGQEEKAKRAIRNALFLAPENRFVLRSMARFFVHLGEEGIAFAHDNIKKSQITKHDPWIIATEISLATLRQRGSTLAKSGLQIVESGIFHPFNTSELASSLATLELKNGKIKNSRKLFNSSLVFPNDNSLAQAEWASQVEKGLLDVNSKILGVGNSFEAMAIDFAKHEQWEEAIESCKMWFLDLPFSKRSVLFANNIAIHKLRDNNLAVDVAKLGLDSHPGDAQLINNIIYSLCLEDRVSEAELYFQKVRKEDINATNEIGICLTATKGLLYFRKGMPDIGRVFYHEAIQLANKLNRDYFKDSALINYTREEILLGQEDVTPLMGKIEEITRLYSGKDLADDAKEVLKLFHQSD